MGACTYRENEKLAEWAPWLPLCKALEQFFYLYTWSPRRPNWQALVVAPRHCDR